MRTDALVDFLHAAAEGSLAALAAIRANALRSTLTSLGIIIGVAAVITVVAVMQGLSHGITAQLDDLGSDMVTLRAHTPTSQQMLGVRNRLGNEDFATLRASTSGLRDMTATLSGFGVSGLVSHGRNAVRSQVIGTDSSYQNVVRVFTEKGRFLSSSDDDRRRRVVVIGPSLQRELDLPENPVGEFLRLGEEWFRVIGVGESRGNLFGFDQDNWILAPRSTIRAVHGAQLPDNVEVLFRLEEGVRLEAVQDQMRRVLRQRHGLQPGEADTFEFVTADRMRSQFASITQAVTLVAAGIVGISLVVGGIGIMNIMLVTVTERTREIGILKALGATPRFVLIQFLVEALVLALMGGLLGLLLGAGLASAFASVVPGMTDVAVPLWAVFLALGFTTLIGVVFGVAPAVKASRLSPIDALRYE